MDARSSDGVIAIHRAEVHAIDIARTEVPAPTSMMVSGCTWLARRKSSLFTASV